jgi:hypothetical protein
MQSDLLAISNTASLVLRWVDGECYTSPPARDYLARLNLSAGAELQRSCEAVWPHYGEVIRNRKHAVSALVDTVLQDNAPLRQIVIAGAGLAPLGIELQFYWPGVKVFEVDACGMRAKAELCRSLPHPIPHGVEFVEAKLARPTELIDRLGRAGWCAEEPTLLIVEGVSYYLSDVQLSAMFRPFRRPRRDSRFLVEYLLPTSSICEDRREISERVFEIIRDGCDLPRITPLGAEQLAALAGGRILRRFGLHEIEQIRTGWNAFFPTPDSGWIEISLLAA